MGKETEGRQNLHENEGTMSVQEQALRILRILAEHQHHLTMQSQGTACQLWQRWGLEQISFYISR